MGWDGMGQALNCYGMGWDGTEKYVPWTSLVTTIDNCKIIWKFPFLFIHFVFNYITKLSSFRFTLPRYGNASCTSTFSIALPILYPV